MFHALTQVTGNARVLHGSLLNANCQALRVHLVDPTVTLGRPLLLLCAETSSTFPFLLLSSPQPPYRTLSSVGPSSKKSTWITRPSRTIHVRIKSVWWCTPLTPERRRIEAILIYTVGSRSAGVQ